MTTERTSGISRRTLAKGAAWAVPAVAVAAAAPAQAQSYFVRIQAGTACKLPSDSCETETGIKEGYTQPITVCTNVPAAVTITFPGTQYVLINGVSTDIQIYTGPATGGGGLQTKLVIPYSGTANRCVDVYVYLHTANSAESSLSGTINWTWTSELPGENGTDSTDLYSAMTPPCDKCEPPAP